MFDHTAKRTYVRPEDRGDESFGIVGCKGTFGTKRLGTLQVPRMMLRKAW